MLKVRPTQTALIDACYVVKSAIPFMGSQVVSQMGRLVRGGVGIVGVRYFQGWPKKHRFWLRLQAQQRSDRLFTQ